MDSAEIERELGDLETRIERLRALYEQYFLGIEKLEPSIPRKEVDRRIHLLRREQIRNTGLRFKFQMLIQRYNTLQEYWRRVAREIENGTYRRDVMRAAQRFGDKAALTIFGKKRAERYAKLAEAQAALRGGRKGPADDDAMELGADDLIEEEEVEVVEDDVTEPMGVPAPAPAPVAAAPAAPPAVEKKGPGLAGLRWGSADPSSAIRPSVDDVKRKVAQLAAEMRAPRAQADPAPGFGALDLDFEEAEPARAAARAPAPVRAPLATPPARAAEAAPPRAAPPPSGFGALDLDLEPAALPPEPPRPPLAKSPAPARTDASVSIPKPSAPARAIADASASRSLPRPPLPRIPSPAAPIRPAPAASPPPAEAPRLPVVPAPRPPPAASDGALSEQRIRQIYTKYVEAKRAAQESTASLTYEKLATKLRTEADRLRGAHPSKSVDYEVVMKDGKPHLKPVLR